MKFRFKIIDRNIFATEIEEPVGWDSISFKLTRDRSWHGLFYDYTAQNFEFWGVGRKLLKTEYEAYGLEGLMWLKVEYDCFDTGNWQHFYTGRFIFAQYNGTCGNDCYIKISIDNISEVIELRNRLEQNVDLLATKCFDTTTNLANYTKAPFSISLPGKTVVLQSNASTTEDNESDNLVGPNWYSAIDDAIKSVISPLFLGFNNVISSDVSNTSFFDKPETSLGGLHNPIPEGTIPFIDQQPFSSLKCIGTNGKLAYRYHCTISQSGDGSIQTTGQLNIVRLPAGADINVAGSLVVIYQQDLWTTLTGNASTSFDVSNELDIALDEGDQLFIFIYLGKNHPEKFDTFFCTMHEESFQNYSVNSLCEASPADVFMINEAMSRIIESITNNKLKLYSEYLGRTDSQPFAFEGNGCGALAVITNGLKIRQAKNTDGSLPSLFISLKDAFESVQAIHNVGLGIEKFLTDENISDDITDDLLNSQSKDFRVRVEDWKFFYKNEVVLTHTDINEITRTVQQEKHYAIFRVGYQKWEAEDFNGLDEFLTKREYRTQLTQVNNVLEKLSKLIASGYAIEVTRRQGSTSKDWRYDNDVFIICVKSDYTVEQGNITNAENIIDPPTIYNYRISPARNLLRWFNTVISSYRKTTSTSQLLFSSGDGNLVAKGQMTSANCRLENAAIAENQVFDTSAFSDIEKALPIFKNETVTYEYPLNMDEFKMLLANPYGQIAFSNDEESGKGWILDVQYQPNEGKAKFTLLPVNTIVTDNEGDNFIITEDGIVITAEDGTPIIIE